MSNPLVVARFCVISRKSKKLEATRPACPFSEPLFVKGIETWSRSYRAIKSNMRLFSLLFSWEGNSKGPSCKPTRPIKDGAEGPSFSIRRPLRAATGRGTLTPSDERASALGQIVGSFQQSSLREIAEPAHWHSSMLRRFVANIHLHVAPHRHREARTLARFVIGRSPARIRGLALQRLDRMCGGIEKCPACPQQCPVPHQPERLGERPAPAAMGHQFSSAQISRTGFRTYQRVKKCLN